MAQDILAGLSAEQKKKIRAQIKEAKESARKIADKDYIILYDGLGSVRKDIDGLIAKAKEAGTIPKSTTLEKLLKMPKVKPKNIGNFVRNNFGRSAEKNKVTANKTPTAKKKTVAKKKKSTTKK